MEPVLYSLQAVLRGALILGLSLSAFAQIPAAPDASGFPLRSQGLRFSIDRSAACSYSAPAVRVSRDSDR